MAKTPSESSCTPGLKIPVSAVRFRPWAPSDTGKAEKTLAPVPGDSSHCAELPSSSSPRFVADQIIFGANETRWQFPDVTADRYQEAAWKARYEMTRLTQTDCFALAEAVNVLTYILFDCPTTGLAVEKLRNVRAAIAARSKEPS